MKGTLGVYLFTSFVGDIIVPIYALFIPLLAAESGASPAEIGIVGGASYVTYSFVPFFAGRYSDRIRVRQGIVVGALAVLAAASLLYVFVANPLELIATRFLEGVGWSMLWPTVQAAIAEDSRREASKSLSIYNTIWSAASALGPLVGVVLIFFFQSIRPIFLLAVVMLLAAVAVNLFPGKIRARRQGLSGEATAESDPAAMVASVAVPASHRLWFYMTALAFVMAVRGVLFTFSLPYARSAGLPVLLVGSVAFFFGASRFVTYVLTLRDEVRGWLLTPASIRRNVLTGVALASVGGTLPIVPDRSGATFLFSFILCGAAASMVMVVSQAEMMRTDPMRRGENAGLQESSIGVGVGFGPVASGLLSGGSLVAPFLFPLFGALVVVPAMLVGARRGRPRPQLAEAQ